jgi:hypothetical protein
MATADGINYAVDSCRTSLSDGTNSQADSVVTDGAKLSVRGDNKAAKSWIKFDISGLDVGSLTSCRLRITLNASKTSTCSLSVINDSYAANIGWTNADLTWNNAPGNYTSSDGVNPDAAITLDQLQDDLDSAVATFVSTVDYSYGGLAGDQLTFDVLPYLQADTDGVVQFVLHGAGGSTDFSTHNNLLGADYWPALVYTDIPTGNCSGVGVPYVAYAFDSCRAILSDGTNNLADTVKYDNNKLSVRGDNKATKSWFKFDLNSLNLNPNAPLKSAVLRITLYNAKSSTCLLSAVNDDYLTNIGWTHSTLTWNNAPGNYSSTDGINPDDGSITVAELQDILNPTQTTPIGTVDYTGGLAGSQYFINVLPILQADTDGIVQFVLHGAGGSTDFATHATSLGAAYWPRLDILAAPAGADNPYPCPESVVGTNLVGLSWTNPDPNDGVSPITCTVYLGTDPNRLTMDSVTLTPDSQGVLINTANFPNYGNLQNLTNYYWIVDCDDPSEPNIIEGLMWNFYVNNNEAPIVNAGSDQTVWLGKSGTPGQEVVYLNGTTSDDGLPNPPAAYTVLWTQENNGAPAVAISPDNLDGTSVTITERGDYEFRLTANDGDASSFDTVRIVVGSDDCDASHIKTGIAYNPGDVNLDCVVDLQDFALLLTANWMDCTDILTNCGN